jgi:[ribosomal protein S5]-alanine N-acetyltransferase
VATRALALLVAWSFAELRMGRVQALVHPDNPGSARVLVRLGFQREGLLRDYRAGDLGREDRLIYSLLSGELVLPQRG